VPRCGDSKIDGLWGEECDDGNTTAGDGCSAACKVEIQ
jgi:cysteine-rich repeat protein